MDSRIKGAVFLLVSALCVALFGVTKTQSAFSAEEPETILGAVVPGKTTLTDLENTLHEKSCAFSEELPESGLNKEITVPHGCFDLPGEPLISAGSDEQGKVSMLRIEWKSDDDGTLYNRYFLALEKSYGRSELTETTAGLKKSATWSIPDQHLCVHLSQVEDNGHGVVDYIIGNNAPKAFESFTHHEEKTGKDLDNL